MARRRVVTFAAVACLLCIVGFVSAYLNFEGYEELDPEQSNLAIVQNGQSFILEVDESDQVWVYVLSENLTDAEYTMTSEGEKYEGVEPSFFDTTLISEDGLRFFSPSIKIGPGFKGSLVIENTGGVPIYLVDMVIMGESLWDQSSVQIMAASCCLAPIFTLIGIVGILQGSKKPNTKPKILVFGPGGLPTTEELYNSINQIEKKEVSTSLAPDPWIEGSQTEPKVVESPPSELTGSSNPRNPDSGGDWKGWDEG